MEYQFNNLYDIVVANANKSRSRAIITEEEVKLSNGEFKERIDIVAEFLKNKCDIKPDDKVAIFMSNSWQYIVNAFAISKIGATVVLINNFLKEDEIAYILNDSQTRLLFSSTKYTKETQNLMKKTDIRQIIWVDGVAPFNNEKNIDYDTIFKIKMNSISAPFASQIEDTAFIFYTSGTTGKPKGAMLSFRNIFSNCEGGIKLMNSKDGQLKLICYLPMFHAFTFTATIMVPIYTNSGLIVVRSLSGVKDFKKLLRTLLISRCRYFTGVPDVYSAMAKAKLPWYFHWFHNVKGFISGAAPISDEVQNRFNRSFKKGKLLQGYGVTECSPIVSCNSVKNNRFGSVGRPLLDYKIKIVDEDMNSLPTGESGEILVKGDNVMKGYYNRPKETEEAIVDGWFKTGDIGYVDKDGFIFIIDRKKDLIIHKGMNIYPREIEEILYTHNKVNACAVIGIKDKEDNEVPAAYIELKENETATESEIKEFLKPQLAAFKQPRRVLFVQKLPRNATGKILKRELRDQILNERPVI
ncbi:MAG: long-chain fatty acid--CoA ligase [Burkholderiales bacterium]|nr:long-chain fatty acid--CoA ligase [Burkholderiales bacterium]